MLKDQTLEKTYTNCNTANSREQESKNNKEKYALIWSECLDFLKKKVRKITFNTWISKLELKEISSDLAVIYVKNEFTKSFIEQSYISLIQEALKEATAKALAIRLEINSDLDLLEDRAISTKQEETIEPAITQQKSIASETNLPKKNKSKLNPNISLEKTYLGDFNKTCYAFAKSIIEDQSNIYKSLYINSESGLGKSHFLHLIGNEAKRINPNLKIKYLSSESFINGLIMSIQKNRTQSFREKYRDLDILLFDDFQALENKKTCQEEFINTYESITSRGGKVIMSSAKKISELKNTNPKINSIVKSALVTSIDEPLNSDKNQLIDFKLAELKINLKEKQKQIIYQTENHCIRELEGNLLQVSALQRFSGMEADSEEFSKAFECNFAPANRGLNIDQIINLTADYFHISREELCGKRRNEEFTRARHLAIYLCYEMLGLSYKKIGSYFSDRKHSSIIYSIKTIESMLSNNLPSSNFTKAAIEKIKSSLV